MAKAKPIARLRMQLIRLGLALCLLAGIGTSQAHSGPFRAVSEAAAAPAAKPEQPAPRPPAGRHPDYRRALPTADILIDAGHGGIDGGTHYEKVLEKDINLAVAKKLYLLLRSKGVKAVLNRNGDYALSDENNWHRSRSRHQRDLSQRSQLSGEIETSILVSLHVNWSKGKSRHGPLVIHQRQGESALLAFCIQDALNRLQHTATVPVAGRSYYLLNVVQRPAVIVEMGFIGNDEDRRTLTDPRSQLRVASAIASGVQNYLLLR